MEEVYRRRTHQPPQRRGRMANQPKIQDYKQAMAKQTMVCILIFVALLLVKLYPNEELEFARSSVRFILNETTDVQQLGAQMKQFVDEYILNKDAAQQPNGLDPVANMVAPLDAPVTSPFGLRTDPIDNKEKFHYGVDLAGETGDKIKCAADGVAAEVGTSEDYGNFVLVKHSEKIFSFYGPCDKVLPLEGDTIKAGQVIATVGSTGRTTGSHLHFEIREEDNSLDPEAFITFQKE